MPTQFTMTDESIFISGADKGAIHDARAVREAAGELEELAAAAKYRASVIISTLHSVAGRPSREGRTHAAELADAQAIKLAPVCGLAATIEEASHGLTDTLRKLRDN